VTAFSLLFGKSPPSRLRRVALRGSHFPLFPLFVSISFLSFLWCFFPLGRNSTPLLPRVLTQPPHESFFCLPCLDDVVSRYPPIIALSHSSFRFPVYVHFPLRQKSSALFFPAFAPPDALTRTSLSSPRVGRSVSHSLSVSQRTRLPPYCCPYLPPFQPLKPLLL